MKKGRTVTFSNFGPWGAVLLGLFTAVACGQTSSPGSGETHFLIRCEDGTCSGGLQCLCGICSKPCSKDSACSSLGESVTCVEHDEASCTTVSKSCDVTCAEDADCRSVSLRHTCVGGLCRILPTPIGSVDEGGAPNFGSAGSPDNAGGGGASTTSGGNGETSGTPVMCEQCGDRPCFLWGTCSKEAACETRHCGGLAVDENGCQRPDCDDDSSCADDARCVSGPIEVIDQGNNAPTRCSMLQGECVCYFYTVNAYVKACAPTATFGQRGNWTALRVREWDYQPGDNLTEWLFSSDGSVQVSIYVDNGGNAPPVLVSQETRLPAHQLGAGDEIDGLASGAALRLELADATPCAAVADYDLDVVLEMDTGKLQKQVAGCAMEQREPFSLLSILMARYRN